MRENGAEICHLNLGHNRQAISVSVDARNLVCPSVKAWAGGGRRYEQAFKVNAPAMLAS